MALVEYRLEDHVAIITWNSGENRFNPEFLQANLDVLDEIEKNTQATVVVVRSAHEKIWSNGLDLEWLMARVAAQDSAVTKTFFFQLNDVFKRFLMFPAITVAAITGHAFAGGAILSCAFDYRFMRTDRGFFCFPEVDINIPFLPGMMALLRKSLPGHALTDMALTGKRITAAQARETGIVQQTYDMSNIMDETIAWAKTMNKRRETVRAIKVELYKHIPVIMDQEDTPIIEGGRLNV